MSDDGVITRRRLLVGCVGFGGGIFIAGCLGGPTEGSLEGDMTEEEFEEFVADKSEAEQTLETTRMSVDITLSGDGQTASMRVDGEVNRSAKIAMLTYDIDAPGPPAPWRPRGTFDTYINDNALYMQRGHDWERYSFEEFEELEDDAKELWNIKYLTVSEDMYHFGDVTVEKTDGEIIVKTALTGQELEAVAGDSPENAVPGLDEVEGGAIDVIVFTETVDAETLYPKEVAISSEMSGGDHTATMEATIVFEDHNRPAISEIPEHVRTGAIDGERPTPF